MACILLIPEPQFADADGTPYAGGTLTTYVTGTSTPKATWTDPGGTALNANPIVLDAAGRCVIYGDGEYRLVLRDVAGNLVWDQPSTTLISAAMQPVCIAPDLATARRLMGIDDAIAAAVAAEASAREAADAAEAAARAAADAAETARAIAKETELQNNLAQERAERIAEDERLAAAYQRGEAATNTSGYVRVTFSPAYSATPIFVASVLGSDNTSVCLTSGVDAYGANVFSSFADKSYGPTAFAWIALASS